MSNLPKNWVFTTLGKVCAKPQYGWTSKAALEGGIKYLRTTDLSSGVVDWDSVPYCLDEPDDIQKYQVEDNDIVISRAGSVGLSYRIENPPPKSVFASYLIRMRATAVEHKYLEYFLKSAEYWQQISDVSAGIAVQNINATKLSDLEIPLAPRPEQKRIVAKLDSLFGHLDQLKARLSTIPVLLKQFRQTVLTQAVTGKLTEEWRDKNEFAWHETTIGGISLLITKGASPKWQGINYVENYTKESILFITSENVDRFRILENKFKYLEIGFNELQKRSILQQGDVLTNIVGGSIGRTAVWNIDMRANINQAVCVIRPDRKQYLPEYLAFFLNSDIGLQSLFSDVVDVARANISLENIRNTKILLPDLEEQKEIINRVVALFEIADRIEASHGKLQEKIDCLPQAILAKAFRGELVKSKVDEDILVN